MLSFLQLIAALLTTTAAFAWINHRILHLPHNIGLLIMGLGASLLLIAAELLFPSVRIYGPLESTLRQIDFYEALMNGMLAFLLFAGALHVDIGRLRTRALGVGTLATLGVVVSAAIVGIGIWAAAQIFGVPLSFGWALVFGALIAPTDPVAVLSTLKSVKVSEELETDMSGEALFNDGVAVVLFTMALQIANDASNVSASQVAGVLLLEVCGGALLGLATGYVAYRALHAIDEYSIEVMISLALVTSTYAVADALHMSGPIAVVVAGVLIGNRAAAYAMSETTKRYVFGFWRLTDDILNALLFLLIGLEVLVLRFDPHLAFFGILAIPLVLLARFVAVGGAVHMLDRWTRFAKGTVPVLTWGGVRGGISVALALSIQAADYRPFILAATYNVVLFSVIVQGLSLGYVVRKTALGGGSPEARSEND